MRELDAEAIAQDVDQVTFLKLLCRKARTNALWHKAQLNGDGYSVDEANAVEAEDLLGSSQAQDFGDFGRWSPAAEGENTPTGIKWRTFNSETRVGTGNLAFRLRPAEKGAATGVALDDAVAGQAFQGAPDRAAADTIVGAELLLARYDGAARPTTQPQLHGKGGRHLVVQGHHRLGLEGIERHALSQGAARRTRFGLGDQFQRAHPGPMFKCLNIRTYGSTPRQEPAWRIWRIGASGLGGHLREGRRRPSAGAVRRATHALTARGDPSVAAEHQGLEGKHERLQAQN